MARTTDQIIATAEALARRFEAGDLERLDPRRHPHVGRAYRTMVRRDGVERLIAHPSGELVAELRHELLVTLGGVPVVGLVVANSTPQGSLHFGPSQDIL